ncbi:MAG: acyloxyacyl hydrolase [Taibaiella sp.]|nr:acyloxyacyl hydrolase [Taibaiella sp.]
MKGIRIILAVILATLGHVGHAQAISRSHLIYMEVGGYGEFGYFESYLSAVNGGYVFFNRPGIWLAGEANLFKFWNSAYSSLGVGVRPSLRLYPLRRPKMGVYFELKGGPIYMFPEFEKEALNYTLLASLGAQIRLSDRKYLYAGCGYTHYSNGKRWGDALNPTWDGIGAQVGIIRTLH